MDLFSSVSNSRGAESYSKRVVVGQFEDQLSSLFIYTIHRLQTLSERKARYPRHSFGISYLNDPRLTYRVVLTSPSPRISRECLVYHTISYPGILVEVWVDVDAFMP